MRFVDITGQTFGDLYVQKYLGDRKYLCLCKRCGKTEEVVAQQLKNGNRTMCKDCRKIVDHEKKVNSRLIDITGQTFGEWHVDYFVGDRIWHCTCSCGTERLIKGPALTHGRTQHCDNAIHTVIDLTGKTFGDWHVDSFAGNHSWNCTCSCGKKSVVDGYQLRSGRSTSCGHATTGFKDLTGQTIGDLTPVQYIGDHKWNCICKCGMPRVVDSWTLRTNATKFGFYRCFHKVAVGMSYRNLTVTKINSDGTIVCHCKCGNDIVVKRSMFYSHSVQSCGCLRGNRYSREEVLAAIERYKRRSGVDPFIEDLANELNMGMTAVYKYRDEYNLGPFLNWQYSSRGEAELASLYPGQTAHIRNILGDGRELDLYYPDKKIALEYNGAFWHSASRKTEDYHQTKTITCIKRGITLVQIFQHEWKNAETKKKLISHLDRLFNKNITYLSDNDIEVEYQISKDQALTFNKLYSVNRIKESEVNIGLVDSAGELVQLLQSNRIDKRGTFEVVDIATKSGVQTYGFSKIFRQFIQAYRPSKIMYQCDAQKLTGVEFMKLGFKFTGIQEPDYKLVDRYDNIKKESKEPMKYQTVGLTGTEKDFEYQKSDVLQDDDEAEIMQYFKVYDCGNLRFIWSPQTEL